jgi:hypothetical protein
VKKLLFFLLALIGVSNLFAMEQDPRDAAADLCDKHYYAADKQACLVAIRGKRFDVRGVQLCDKHYYAADKQACLVAIADLTWSQRSVDVCDQHYFAADKQKCLVETGEKMPTDEWGSIEKDELIVKLRSAISHINQGNDSAAKRVLFHVIERVENP